jgi:hypothetical protein
MTMPPVVTIFPNRDAIAVASLKCSSDPLRAYFDESLSIYGLHPTAGLDLIADAAGAIPASVHV